MVKKVGNATGRPTKRQKAIKAKQLDLRTLKPEKPQDKVTETKVKMLQEKTVDRKVWELINKGFSQSEIAELLDVHVTSIEGMIANSIHKIDEENEHLKQRWQQITLARIEYMMKKLLVQTENREIDRDDVIMLRELVELESEVQGFGHKNAPIFQQGNFINQIDTSSPVYKATAAQMQIETTGRTVPELAAYVQEPNSMYDELDNIEFDD